MIYIYWLVYAILLYFLVINLIPLPFPLYMHYSILLYNIIVNFYKFNWISKVGISLNIAGKFNNNNINNLKGVLCIEYCAELLYTTHPFNCNWLYYIIVARDKDNRIQNQNQNQIQLLFLGLLLISQNRKS